MITRIVRILPILFIVVACYKKAPEIVEQQPKAISDDSLLTLVEYRTFQYFWDGAEPTSGAARERYHSDNIYPENDKHIITSGGTGFGVMAILVGIERNFITREQGLERLTKLVIGWRKLIVFMVFGHTGSMVKQEK